MKARSLDATVVSVSLCLSPAGQYELYDSRFRPYDSYSASQEVSLENLTAVLSFASYHAPADLQTTVESSAR